MQGRLGKIGRCSERIDSTVSDRSRLGRYTWGSALCTVHELYMKSHMNQVKKNNYQCIFFIPNTTSSDPPSNGRTLFFLPIWRSFVLAHKKISPGCNVIKHVLGKLPLLNFNHCNHMSLYWTALQYYLYGNMSWNNLCFAACSIISRPFTPWRYADKNTRILLPSRHQQRRGSTYCRNRANQ